VAAAVELFTTRGFGATRLSDVAERAGIAKGTIYLYCESKTALFRRVARAMLDEAVVPKPAMQALSFPERIERLLGHAAETLSDGRISGLIRLIISESRTFPDLTQIWHDEVAAQLVGLLVSEITDAQARGEIGMGDPRLFAFSLAGPLIAASLFGEVFSPAGATPPDLAKLASQHADAILNGLLRQRSEH
jgi:AcrR family transcriptional regulator